MTEITHGNNTRNTITLILFSIAFRTNSECLTLTVVTAIPVTHFLLNFATFTYVWIDHLFMTISPNQHRFQGNFPFTHFRYVCACANAPEPAGGFRRAVMILGGRACVPFTHFRYSMMRARWRHRFSDFLIFWWRHRFSDFLIFWWRHRFSYVCACANAPEPARYTLYPCVDEIFIMGRKNGRKKGFLFLSYFMRKKKKNAAHTKNKKSEKRFLVYLGRTSTRSNVK